MDYLNKHLLIELYGCDTDRTNDIIFVEKIMKEAAGLAGLKDMTSHFFKVGMRGVLVGMDSLYIFHTFPENGYVGLDLYTSNKEIDNEKALAFLVRKFGATKYSASEIKRGNKTEE